MTSRAKLDHLRTVIVEAFVAGDYDRWATAIQEAKVLVRRTQPIVLAPGQRGVPSPSDKRFGPRLRVPCVRCGKRFPPAHLARWHNDKCKGAAGGGQPHA